MRIHETRFPRMTPSLRQTTTHNNAQTKYRVPSKIFKKFFSSFVSLIHTDSYGESVDVIAKGVIKSLFYDGYKNDYSYNHDFSWLKNRCFINTVSCTKHVFKSQHKPAKRYRKTCITPYLGSGSKMYSTICIRVGKFNAREMIVDRRYNGKRRRV